MTRLLIFSFLFFVTGCVNSSGSCSRSYVISQQVQETPAETVED